MTEQIKERLVEPRTHGECMEIYDKFGFARPESPSYASTFPNAILLVRIHNSKLDREDQLIQEVKTLREKEFAACSKHHEYHDEIDSLEQQLEAKDKEIQRLLEVEKDYSALQQIMDRARRLAFLTQEEEEDRPRFKMDKEGHLTRIED